MIVRRVGNSRSKEKTFYPRECVWCKTKFVTTYSLKTTCCRNCSNNHYRENRYVVYKERYNTLRTMGANAFEASEGRLSLRRYRAIVASLKLRNCHG